MNLIEFLEARITEDERRAKYYGPYAMCTRRVLAECAAKRAIIYLADGDFPILRNLAAVYANHADYRQEWAL